MGRISPGSVRLPKDELQIAFSEPLEAMEPQRVPRETPDEKPVPLPEIERAEPQRKRAKLTKTKRRSRLVQPLVLQLGFLVIVAIVLAGVFLVREERLAATSAESNKVKREIEGLQVTLDARKTAYECSIDLAAIKTIASTRLGMSYPSEDQIVYIDYDDTSMVALEVLPVVAAPHEQSDISADAQAEEESNVDMATDIIPPEEVTIILQDAEDLVSLPAFDPANTVEQQNRTGAALLD